MKTTFRGRHTSSGHRREKTRLQGFADNKGPDQPGHPHSLIRAFVIRFLEINISKLSTGEISMLVSVAEEKGLSLTLSETPKTGFVVSRPILLQYLPAAP